VEWRGERRDAAAEHLDDVEGDLLAACREIVGEAVPIITSWDQHANMTDLRVKSASMIIGHKTNPHSDYVPIGRVGEKPTRMGKGKRAQP
jgi:microcystin degradation protein MlrC